jgi:predicted DNA-binding transcriptional regulator AlpA
VVSRPPTSERYVDARELAELMGVSTSTVKRMVAAGMPSETWGMSRTRRFLPSLAIGWASARAKMPQPRDRHRKATGQQKE